MYSSSRRPIASERVDKKPNDDIEIIKFLLEENCPFFSSKDVSFADLLKSNSYDVEDFVSSTMNLEPVEIAANERSFQLFKLLPKHLSPKDCWRVGMAIIELNPHHSNCIFYLIHAFSPLMNSHFCYLL